MILAATLDPPFRKQDVTPWPTRPLTVHLDIGDATVARFWRKYRLRPWRHQTFRCSADPKLVAKVTDVVGLHLNPPRNAVVICADELGPAGAPRRLYRRCVSSACPPNRTCVSPRIRLSANPCHRAMRAILTVSLQRGWRCWRPRSRNGIG